MGNPASQFVQFNATNLDIGHFLHIQRAENAHGQSVFALNVRRAIYSIYYVRHLDILFQQDYDLFENVYIAIRGSAHNRLNRLGQRFRNLILHFGPSILAVLQSVSINAIDSIPSNQFETLLNEMNAHPPNWFQQAVSLRQGRFVDFINELLGVYTPAPALVAEASGSALFVLFLLLGLLALALSLSAPLVWVPFDDLLLLLYR